MSRYLESLLQRSLHPMQEILPRLPALFEPDGPLPHIMETPPVEAPAILEKDESAVALVPSQNVENHAHNQPLVQISNPSRETESISDDPMSPRGLTPARLNLPAVEIPYESGDHTKEANTPTTLDRAEDLPAESQPWEEDRSAIVDSAVVPGGVIRAALPQTIEPYSDPFTSPTSPVAAEPVEQTARFATKEVIPVVGSEPVRRALEPAEQPDLTPLPQDFSYPTADFHASIRPVEPPDREQNTPSPGRPAEQPEEVPKAPVIHITIGRIEVRAVAAPPEPPSPSPKKEEPLSLQEYLKRYSRQA